MKYTKPIYENEAIETRDAITASIVAIAYVNKVIGKDENGEDITVKATEVTVDVSNLF